jgi:hypothetical protein
LLISTTEGPSVPVFTGIWTVELPMLKEPVVALMGLVSLSRDSSM